MKKLLLGLGLVILCSELLFAASLTLTYTAPQDTAIQNRLIPRFNGRHCRRFGLPISCSTAQLVTAGCLNRVVTTLTIDSCTIFTSNAAGEQAFVQELANIELVKESENADLNEQSDFCANFKAQTQGQKDAVCAALTPPLPAGCKPCP